MKTMRRFDARAIAVAAALGATVLLPTGGAWALTAAQKCQSAIAKNTAKYAQARVKALQKCQDGRFKGTISSCPDPTAQAKISTAEAKRVSGTCKACGGTDKACGGAPDTNPGDIGWNVCPGFEGQGAFLIQPTQSLNAVLTCVGDANTLAVDQLINFLYGMAPSTDPNILKCQRTIGKNVAKFFQTKSKTLQKCWDGRIKGKHSNACPDSTALTKINDAEQKKIDKITGACSAFTPAQIGITTCPDVGTCGSLPMANISNLIACVDCVAEFKVDCIDALQVPQFVTYPLECSPAKGTCFDRMEVEVAGGDLDNGWTGIGHDEDVPSSNLVTVTISNCAGSQIPTCGQCELGGPVPNERLSNNQRCSGDNARECTSDAQCNVGPCSGGQCAGEPSISCSTNSECNFGVCSFYFGNPLPLSAGNVPVCVFNRLTTPITGTVNLDTGESAAIFELDTLVMSGLTTDRPCPTCEGDIIPADGIRDGTCSGGEHNGDPCDVSGDAAPFGLVSFDCPSNPGAKWGELTINMNPLTTGTETRTLTVASPKCTASGFSSLKCMCDTCSTAQAEWCMSDADCPSGATCGGKRCLSGDNNGVPCTLDSECPGGACSLKGQRTQPNQCSDLTCVLNPLDTASAQEGECAGEEGPVDLICQAQPFRQCSTNGDCRRGTCSGNPVIDCANDSDCPVGQTCEIPFPDDICITKIRNCFMDNGLVGGSVIASGQAGPPGSWAGAFAFPKLAALFCEGPTDAPSVNITAGLPGLGRLTVPATVVLKRTP